MNERDQTDQNEPHQGRRLPQKPRRYSDEFLRRLRNEIPIRAVIQTLAIPHKYRDGYFRFLCPVCEFTHTGINPEANLARCFRCERNFNPIELVMAAESADFVLAVSYLAPMLRSDQQR
jgi:DNA primase